MTWHHNSTVTENTLQWKKRQGTLDFIRQPLNSWFHTSSIRIATIEDFIRIQAGADRMLSYLGHILEKFSQKGRAALLQIIKPIGLHDSCKNKSTVKHC
uniref:Uncharacterized protein n=1 Tax=Arundo donax TaxID=35708 RepID=A0A0A9CQ29_ARUDO